MTTLSKRENTPYNETFYLNQRDKSYESAGCVLPVILSLLPVESAVDVGCGVGTWASKLIELGVKDVLGIDGDYVNREMLRIPPASFQAFDLEKTIAMNRRFSLAICMEVGEHLQPSRAGGLVEDLIGLAPAVLFSAAIPGQGGTNHINEQYLSYWSQLFAAKDFVLVDVVRPNLWNDERCDWVYRQNAVLFVHKEDPLVAHSVPSGVDYVHPILLDRKREALEKPLLGYLVRSFPGTLARSVRKRLGLGPRDERC